MQTKIDKQEIIELTILDIMETFNCDRSEAEKIFVQLLEKFKK